MERKNFTEEEINKLKENKFVKSITTKSIILTNLKNYLLKNQIKERDLLEYL